MECLTCRMIAMIDKSYPHRKASFGNIDGRCLWHAWEEDEVWRCDGCGRFVIAENITFCLKEKKYVCKDSSPSQRKEASFWLWKFYLDMECSFCGESHPALQRQEFLGEHPWQADPFSCKDFPIWYPDGKLIEEKDVGES